MRLSTALIYQNGLNGVLNQEAAMARLQEQLSSGRRVLTPADDPLAAALAINVSQTSSMNSNYDANRKQAEQALGAQTNTLQSVVKNMQEMLKRVVEAGNGTMSDADRQALVIALKGAREELVGLANATDGNGQYLFSGYKGFTQPYSFDAATGKVTYNGDLGQRGIQVDQSRLMSGGDVGSDIFNSVTSGTLAYIADAGAGNTGTGQYSAVSFDGPRAGNYVGRDFRIEFTRDAVTDELQSSVLSDPPVVPPEQPLPANMPYSEGSVIDMNGVSIKLSGQPEAGDVFTVETPKSWKMGVQGDAANTGSATLTPVSLPDGLTGKNLSVAFLDDGAGGLLYSVTSTPPDPSLPANVPVKPGDVIDIGGLKVKVDGQPAAGDTYAVTTPKSANVDVFDTLNDLIGALDTPISGDPQAAAALANTLATANKKLNLSLDNVLTVQASVGARLNELEALGNTGAQKVLSYVKQLSDLEDVNIYQATSDLLLRQVALQAASLALQRIQGNSLFSMGR